MKDLMKDRIEQLTDYIMKRCLWQFHSRAWDRKDQNEGILTKTTQLLCGERVELETPADKCYWVDAVCLAKGFKGRFPWLAAAGPRGSQAAHAGTQGPYGLLNYYRVAESGT
jgi:Fe-only nitrogenase delta subunit